MKLKIEIKDIVKKITPRTIIQQKSKIQSNKKYYKRDRNKSWKKDY
jgi:hypothetical protein